MQKHVVACCPICGAPVSAQVVVTASQDDVGNWILDPSLSSDELNDSINNVNQEVECTNEYCGNPYLGNQVINLNGSSLFVYWLSHYTDLANDTEFDSLTQEMKDEYDAWVEQLEYIPWHGALGDCLTLDGTLVEAEMKK